jgi:phosphoribosyl 1,2-cyclic phosphodiesterase
LREVLLMRFAMLGSGSAGNGLVVQIGRTRLLLDCGFSLRETILRLARIGLEPQQLSGILLTHEHDDHSRGAFRFCAAFGLPLYLTYGTYVALGEVPPEVDFRIMAGHEGFAIGDAHVQPYPVPHDAREPVQYVFGDGTRRLGVLTDTGTSTPHIETMLTACDALVLECNHDLDMLMNNPRYPYSLKRRISGSHGHLDNNTSAQLLARLDKRRLQHIVAAHLSRKNNRPELALAALSSAIDCEEEWIGVADQELGLDWRQIA